MSRWNTVGKEKKFRALISESAYLLRDAIFDQIETTQTTKTHTQSDSHSRGRLIVENPAL